MGTLRRRLVRTGAALGALLAFPLVLGACRDSSTSTSTPSYLFVLTGRNTEFTPSAGQSDTILMSMELGCEQIDDCPPVIWFTDRPIRDSGSMSAAQFVGLWTVEGSDGFGADPPNVAIEIPPDRNGTSPSTVVATMRDATLVRGRSNGDSIRLVATFDVLPEEMQDSIGQGDSHLAAHTDTLIDVVPRNAGALSIFVDAATDPYTFVVAALADPEAD